MSNVKEAERPKGGRAGPLCGRVNVREDFRWERWCSHAVPIAKGALISDSSSIPLPLPPHKAASVALGLRSSQGRQARTDALCYRSESPRFVCVYHFCQWTITDSTFTLLPEISHKTKQKKNHIQDSCRLFEGPVWVVFNTNYKLTHRVNRSIQLTVEREHYATLTASVQHQLYCFM